MLSSTCGVGLVTGLIGALILALTPDVTNATDCTQFVQKSPHSPYSISSALIAGIVLVVIAALAFAAGITFCICKGGDVCDLCAG